MGTDVHMIGEYWDKFDDEWRAFTIPDYFTGRDYSFFAAIGNVRNGTGFAGVPTFKPIEPITDNRGFPDDLSLFGKKWADNGEESDVYKLFGWPGDHSFSWCTLEELKNYKWPITERTGVVPLDEYQKLNGANPVIWSGAVGGKNIITVDQVIIEQYEPKKDEKCYVQMRWNDTLVDPKFVQEFITFLSWHKSWDAKDSQVRIVFGFDS